MTLALGREWHFGDAREALELFLTQAEFSRGDNERAFGRIALHAPALLVMDKRRVIGERSGAQCAFDRATNILGLRQRLAVERELAFRDIAAAADLDLGAGRVDRAHRHFIAGQRAGLVGADHGRGAERLDRRKLAHDGIRGRHAAHAQTKTNGHDRRQRLRNRRDRKRDREQEQRREWR